MPWKDDNYRKEYMRLYAQRPDQVEKRKKWAAAQTPERMYGYQRKWCEGNPRNAIVVKSRSSAKQRGFEFTITEKDLTWPTHCPILGIELAYTGKGERRDNYPSLDRFDNAKGYIPGNVHVISWRANRIKWDCTPAELRAVADYAERSLPLP